MTAPTRYSLNPRERRPTNKPADKFRRVQGRRQQHVSVLTVGVQCSTIEPGNKYRTNNVALLEEYIDYIYRIDLSLQYLEHV